YPVFNVSICPKPVGVVVTPTKGLASNIMHVLKSFYFNIDTFAYTSDNLSTKQRASIDILKEITSCQYQIVCVDSEHLRKHEWFLIANSTTFRQNLIFACAEEGHVINEWGLTFQPMFRHIGTFFCGRLPSTISVFTMTATMQPGPPLLSIIPYLNQHCKTVIHAQTIDLGYRIFLYLLKLLPKSSNPLRRIRMYNSLASNSYNEKTIDTLDTDPHCQIVIATKAMSVGIHAEKLQDSISVGTSETHDCGKQEGGHAGQNHDELAC
ncbi:hypothetical protein BDP27DRAFT_1243155, partial [Rhodocollybia butyracea]